MKITQPIWALGTMSGTSLDGVDAAMLRTDGIDIIEFGDTGFRPYKDAERETIKSALGLWGDAPGVEEAAEVVEAAHTSLMSRFENVALAGFHGQTLAHEPGGRGTHQAGDGALLAELLGVPVAWDFRSADVALGGQGAPLAPFYHHACARYLGAKLPVAFLNLGGVGNITWVDPRQPEPQVEGALLAFDTGPANAPVNDLMVARLGQSRDEDGALAANGTVRDEVVEEFLSDVYFSRMPPKSLDRDGFDGLQAAVAGLSDADAAATLTACAAAGVKAAMEHLPSLPDALYLCGGGRHNATLVAMLRAGLDVNVVDIDETGLNGDMLEAQAFAYLAVRVARGLPTSCPGTTGVSALVGGGMLSHPSQSSGSTLSIASVD